MERRVLTLLLVATVMVLVWAEMGLLAWFLAGQTTGWLLTTPELTSPWWLRWWASWVSGSGGSSLPSTKIDSPPAATPPQQNTWPPHTPQTKPSGRSRHAEPPRPPAPSVSFARLSTGSGAKERSGTSSSATTTTRSDEECPCRR